MATNSTPPEIMAADGAAVSNFTSRQEAIRFGNEAACAAAARGEYHPPQKRGKVRMAKRRYVAAVYRNAPKPCAEHANPDTEADGFYALLDCGCMVEQEIGESDSLPAARMLVARTIKRGLASGDPLAVGGGYVEDREDGETVWSY